MTIAVYQTEPEGEYKTLALPNWHGPDQIARALAEREGTAIGSIAYHATRRHDDDPAAAIQHARDNDYRFQPQDVMRARWEADHPPAQPRKPYTRRPYGETPAAGGLNVGDALNADLTPEQERDFQATIQKLADSPSATRLGRGRR